jgi:ferric-dicitrate binding protein FerR (iron transport regulator)
MLGTWLGIIAAACAVVAAWVGVAKLRDDRRREREAQEERETAQRAAHARAAERRLEVVDRLPEGFSANLPEVAQSAEMGPPSGPRRSFGYALLGLALALILLGAVLVLVLR